MPRIRLGPKDRAKLQDLTLKNRRNRVLVREKAVPVDARSVARHKKAMIKYENHLSHVYSSVLDAVMRAVATAQAVTDVNSSLENAFGMSGVSIDSSRVQTAALEVMQVEIAEALLKKSPISQKSRRELAARIVGRLVPLRDGAPAPTPYPTKVTRDDRVGDLERLIKKELKRSYPAGSKRVEVRGRIDE